MIKQKPPFRFMSWISGNITPPSWYHKIVTQSGRPDFVSIAILADVMNWYQPNRNGEQKFKSDKLQMSYQAYADMFNVSKHIIKQSFDLLEAQGLIKREFRTIETISGLIMNNIMYISPVIDNIKSITIDTDTKNNPPPKVYGETPPKVYGETPPKVYGETPPKVYGETPPKVYGDIRNNDNKTNNKNDSNCKNQIDEQKEKSPAVALNISKEKNLQESTICIAEFNKRKFEAIIQLIPEKYKEPFVLSYLKKSIAEEDYTEEYYINAILYTNDHAKGDVKQYRSYLGQTIDKQWAVNYVSKKKNVLTKEEKIKKELEEKRKLPTSFLLNDAENGCLIANQILNERPTEQLKQEYEKQHCLAAKTILIQRGVLPPPEEQLQNTILQTKTMPSIKTEKEKIKNWEKQKKALREFMI